jgi:hypothetical protein
VILEGVDDDDDDVKEEEEGKGFEEGEGSSHSLRSSGSGGGGDTTTTINSQVKNKKPMNPKNPKKPKKKPFFLYVALTEPHLPHTPHVLLSHQGLSEGGGEEGGEGEVGEEQEVVVKIGSTATPSTLSAHLHSKLNRVASSSSSSSSSTTTTTTTTTTTSSSSGRGSRQEADKVEAVPPGPSYALAMARADGVVGTLCRALNRLEEQGQDHDRAASASASETMGHTGFSGLGFGGTGSSGSESGGGGAGQGGSGVCGGVGSNTLTVVTSDNGAPCASLSAFAVLSRRFLQFALCRLFSFTPLSFLVVFFV